jgi:hypothetical protein
MGEYYYCICALFVEVVSNLDYIMSNICIRLNNELERM